MCPLNLPIPSLAVLQLDWPVILPDRRCLASCRWLGQAVSVADPEQLPWSEAGTEAVRWLKLCRRLLLSPLQPGFQPVQQSKAE
jgi:hypothetical protein